MKTNIRSNFDTLRAYQAQLCRLGALVKRYFAQDPKTSLLKLRQFSELLAQLLAARTLFSPADRIEAQWTAGCTQAPRLSPLVLARKVCGPFLVPQSPS